MIWGCDLGTRKVAVSCPELGYTAALELPKLRTRELEDRVSDVRKLSAFVTSHIPPGHALWIEKPFLAQHTSFWTAVHMGMVAGSIIAAHDGPSFLVITTAWKRAVVGSGNAGKDQIRQWLAANHPALAEACQANQDLVDATCVGLYGGSPTARELEGAWRVQRAG